MASKKDKIYFGGKTKNMKLFNTTKKWADWWKNRKISWKEHYMTPNHPHRLLIVEVLKKIPWMSLLEVGCGAGANLVAIVKAIPDKQVGGIDINKDAIDFAQKQFVNGLFKINPADDIMISDKSTDIVLTDMLMIYVTPWKIKRYLKEFKRISRNYVVFCEFYTDRWWEKVALKWKEGYNAYNYKRLLEKNGFYDIQLYKLPKEFWPESDLQQKFAHIIVARVPKNY